MSGKTEKAQAPQTTLSMVVATSATLLSAKTGQIPIIYFGIVSTDTAQSVDIYYSATSYIRLHMAENGTGVIPYVHGTTGVAMKVVCSAVSETHVFANYGYEPNEISSY